MGGTWIDVEQFGEITTRAMGTLGNPNVLAEYLVLVIMMGCILLFTEKSITNKLLYVVSIGIMLLGLGLTYSRGGISIAHIRNIYIFSFDR
jgi:putative inorganic carbon (HCO3(-)) transporter